MSCKISAGERPAAAHLLRSWVRIPPGTWIFVCCECRVLSGRVLCDELITRPGDSYRLWCVVVCDLETSRIGAPYIYDISNPRVNITLKHPKKYKPHQCNYTYTILSCISVRYRLLAAFSEFLLFFFFCGAATQRGSWPTHS